MSQSGLDRQSVVNSRESAKRGPGTRTKSRTVRDLGIHTVFAAIVLRVALAGPGAAGAAMITLSPGANIQSAINLNPGGTAFVLQPGVYRMQALIPKQGDSFTGQAGADLNGSQVLSNWVHSGSHWTTKGAPALARPAGSPSTSCNDPSTGCAYPQDLYLNSAPLIHKLGLPIAFGEWYFDYRNDVVYIVDNPSGQTVELGVAQHAFSGYVSNVTVQNLIVEKYATPLMSGAIAPYGSYWTIKSNEVRLNHGAGIKPAYRRGNYVQILNNKVHNNGQQGIAVGGGTGTLIQYNTISANGYANIRDGTEGGGSKISATKNVQVLNNIYLNNNGVGLWADSGATGTLFSGNTISGSRLDGIRYEISHYGTISNNVLIHNDQDPTTGKCIGNSREIVLAESDNTGVIGNMITTNCAGITMSSGARKLVINDTVTDNTITYSGSPALRNYIGGWDTHIPSTLFNPANGNYFDYNTYHFTSSGQLSQKNWRWNNTPLSWAGWRAAGQDTHAIAD